MQKSPQSPTIRRAIRSTVIVLTVAWHLTACNGSHNDDSNLIEEPAAPLFAGTVSTPKGIAEPVVTLKAPDGTRVETPVDASGRFSLTSDQSGVRQGDQYLMRVDLGNDNYIYSFAYLPALTNRQNIHSYTDLVARSWFADQGQDIHSVFASAADIDNFPAIETISAIDTNVQAIVSDVLQVYGLENTNLSSADYEATDTGIDRFLNENPVIIRGNRATIIVNDPNTNLQATAVDHVRLNTSFGEVDITPPTQPQNLRALGSRSNHSNNSTTDDAIVLAWSTASDDIGVATYEIFRNDTLINHTPFPVYRDTNIEPDTDYIYTIVTVDESGNRSIPSVQAIGRTLTEADTTAPAIPSSATLNGSTESIQIFWRHTDIHDLTRFEITRTGEDGILVREVTGLELNDITVASGTEYCYSIVAVDASNNRSDSNPISCMTTSGAAVETQTTPSIPATVEMAQDTISGAEGSIITAYVSRLGDATGEVSIDYVITAGTATAEEDYTASDGTLVWTDGDITAKRIEVRLLPDSIAEEPETFSIVLIDSSTDAVISNALTTVTIVDVN